MNKNKNKLGPKNFQWWLNNDGDCSEEWWESEYFNFGSTPYERKMESYDYLSDYSRVFNMYPARVAQPNPFSNKVMFIIDALNNIGVKYTTDIFSYDGHKLSWSFGDHEHKLVNIIIEPNPQQPGPALLFCAHHDIVNPRSENCQDNGASVCNLIRLAALIKKSEELHQRVIILLSDAEECGLKGARKFAKDSKKIKDSNNIMHNVYGEISGAINLELTGLGQVIWSDCKDNAADKELHKSLEESLGKKIVKLSTPPSDAIAFREYSFPTVCVGILPDTDMKHQQTWRLCHSMEDTLTKCDRKNMEDFTTFLFNLTKTNQKTKTEYDSNLGANQTAGTVRT